MVGFPVLLGGILKISYPVISILSPIKNEKYLDFITSRGKIMIDTYRAMEITILGIDVPKGFGFQIFNSST